MTTALNLIQMAHEDAGKITIGGTCSAAQNSRGISRLNDLINLWATQGLKLWLQTDIPVPLVAGTATYTLGPGGSVNMTKPLSVLQAYYLYPVAQGSVRQPLVTLSRDEYTRLSQTSTQGALNSYFTDKQATQLAVSVWNVPDATAATGTLQLITRVSATNVTVTGDTIGFPPEWSIALRWALADELASGQPRETQDRCAQRAGAYRTALEDFDVEDAETFFKPDSRLQYYGGRFR